MLPGDPRIVKLAAQKKQIAEQEEVAKSFETHRGNALTCIGIVKEGTHLAKKCMDVWEGSKRWCNIIAGCKLSGTTGHAESVAGSAP